MANFPSYAGVTGASGPITITAQHTVSGSNGGSLIGPISATGPTGPVDKVLRYGNSTLRIGYDKITLDGDVKEAAIALAKDILDDGDALSTTYNFTLRIHQKHYYRLEYLLDNKPDFFNELEQQFERVCKLKAFA